MPLFRGSRRFFFRAIQIARIPAALAILLLSPQPAHANPVIWLKGEIHIAEHGLSYRKPIKLTSYCYWGNDGQKDVYSSHSIYCPCYGCAIDISFGGGECDLVVETLEGEKLIFDGFLNDASISNSAPSPGAPWRNFEATIDIEARTYEFVKTQSTGLPINSYQTLFGVALLLTLCVENLALLVLKHILKLTDVKIKRLLLVGSTASLATLPCVWFLLPQVWSLLPFNTYAYCIAVAEGLVIIIEARIHCRALGIRVNRALLLSFAANGLSFLVGALLL